MASEAAVQPGLPIDLVEEILVLLDNVDDLARASVACASFRRLIADDCFLRRFRSLHRPRPPILGFVDYCNGVRGFGFSFHPAKPPCLSAPAARALVGAACFSALPKKPSIGTTAMSAMAVSSSPNTRGATCFSFKYLVVYDALRHRHVRIPPIPTNLMPTTGLVDCDWPNENPFLVLAAAGEDDSRFRVVMCNVLSKDSQQNFNSFVYSSITGQWRAGTPFSIASYQPLRLVFLRRYYAHGCLYWVDFLESNNMLVLDMSGMKFSIVVDLLPGSCEHRDNTIGEVGEDRIGLLILGENTLDLYSKPKRDEVFYNA